MKKLGFKVRVDEIGNLIGEVGEGTPKILLCGHMDTVPGYIPVRIIDGKLYGRGAVDAKSPLASMILAASSVTEKVSSGKIVVVGTIEEEKSGRGVKHLIEKGLSADYAVFGEPSGIENIVIGYKGNLKLKITCKTQTGHSASPWLFENSIEKAFEICNMIKGIHFPNEDLNSRFYSLTSCILRLKGGESAANNVPWRCEAIVDIRVPPQLTCLEVLEEINDRLTQYRNANQKVTVKIQVIDSTEAFELSKNNRLVHVLSSTIREIRGKIPVLVRKTGTSDMNILGRILKIPIVAYGPGNSSLDHTPNEHIEIKDYMDCIKIFQKFLAKMFSYNSNSE